MPALSLSSFMLLRVIFSYAILSVCLHSSFSDFNLYCNVAAFTKRSASANVKLCSKVEEEAFGGLRKPRK